MSVIYAEPYPASTRGDRWHAWPASRKAMGLGPHRGQDWAPGDVPAIALSDGVIEAKYPLSESRILGNVVVVRDADGVFWSYSHLAGLPSAPVGSHVERGKSIGARVGNTGSASGGRHAHIVVAKTAKGVFEGDTLDPLEYIERHSAKAPAKPAAKPAAAKPAPTKAARRQTTARAGEGLYAVADRTKVAYDRLLQLNPGIKPSGLELGQTIYLS